MSSVGGASYRYLVVRSFWVICLSACIGSFVVLFCSVQYMDDNLGKRRHIVLEQDEMRDVKDLAKENQELKQTVELLRFGIRSGDNLIQDDRLVSKDGSWQERRLKNVQNNGAEFNMVTDRELSCKDIADINVRRELGRGYTKVTHLGVHNGAEVAIKSAALDSIDVQRCVKEKRMKTVQDCMLFSRYKIMKELLLYQQLRHPNIVKVLGYCMQNDQDTNDIKTRGLTVVTELGVPVDMMMLLQMPWHQRFRVAVGLARLVHFLSNSPLGSLVIHDFQLTQFVLVDAELKISDLDDVGNEPQLCRSSNDCIIGNNNYNTTLKCLRGQCQGFNEKWNMYDLHRFYLKTFLVPGAPEHVVSDLKTVETQTGLLSIDSKELVDGLERILKKLRDGEGLNITVNNNIQYKVVHQADYPGRHDYDCPQSWSSVNCQLMALNEDEARQQCNEDPQCKAFVMTYEKTWTGYRYVFFKNDTSQVVYSANNVVYVKIT